MVGDYYPERGDIVWIDFNPQKGHEQRGRRPAIVLSSKVYNENVGLALFCPITSKIKNYPFVVNLPKDFPVNGVIISDQIKSLDWRTRNIEYIAKAPIHAIEETIENIKTLLSF